jgi:hypothetical protein
VAVKLSDGSVVVWDGRKLRHCASVLPATIDGEPPPNDQLEGRFRRDRTPSVPNRFAFGFGYMLCGSYHKLKWPRVVLPIRSKGKRQTAPLAEDDEEPRRMAPEHRRGAKKRKV